MLTRELDTQIPSSSQSLTLGQAAKEAGVTKAAVRAAIQRKDIIGASQNERGHYAIPLAQVLQYKQRFTSTPTDTVDLEPDTPVVAPVDTPVRYPENMVPKEVYRDVVRQLQDWEARYDRQESRLDRLLVAPVPPLEEGRAVWPWVISIAIVAGLVVVLYVNLNPVT